MDHLKDIAIVLSPIITLISLVVAVRTKMEYVLLMVTEIKRVLIEVHDKTDRLDKSNAVQDIKLENIERELYKKSGKQRN